MSMYKCVTYDEVTGKFKSNHENNNYLKNYKLVLK